MKSYNNTFNDKMHFPLLNSHPRCTNFPMISISKSTDNCNSFSHMKLKNCPVEFIIHSAWLFLLIFSVFPLHSTGDKMDIFLLRSLSLSLSRFFICAEMRTRRRKIPFVVAVVVVICCRFMSRRTWCMPWHRVLFERSEIWDVLRLAWVNWFCIFSVAISQALRYQLNYECIVTLM